MKKLLVFLVLFLSFLNPNIAQMLYDKTSMPGAKFYFSSKPFSNSHDGAKTSFKSNEFIYGRLELENKTLKEAFQLTSIKEGPHYLVYHIASYNRNNQQTGGTNSMWKALLIKEDQLNNKWLNFDILPEPSKATSKLGVVNEQGIGDFDKVAAAPLYFIMSPENFPADDEYTIYTQFYLMIRDGWGNLVNDDNKWPYAEGSFSFNFNSSDVTVLQDNGSAAREKLNTIKVDKLPEYFTHPVTISDPTVTVDKVAPIIKNHLRQYEYELLKVALQPASSMWSIVKNDFGIVSYRYVTGYYRIVYKKDGKCQLGSVRMIQDYINNGQYGDLYCKFWPNEGDLDCGNLK
jgi:hypothetical protein